jgi:anti-sigma factor ChrR (cupin superfamily)
MNPQMHVIKAPKDWIELKAPGSENVAVKIIRADEEADEVIALARFGKGGRMPRHLHHCTAIGYTLSGRWDYDEGPNFAGDFVYEGPGNEHTPWSDEGTEMLLIFRGDNGLYLDNFLDDGTVFHIGMRFFKALEGITPEQAEKLDWISLVDLLPGKRPVGQAA